MKDAVAQDPRVGPVHGTEFSQLGLDDVSRTVLGGGLGQIYKVKYVVVTTGRPPTCRISATTWSAIADPTPVSIAGLTKIVDGDTGPLPGKGASICTPQFPADSGDNDDMILAHRASGSSLRKRLGANNNQNNLWASRKDRSVYGG